MKKSSERTGLSRFKNCELLLPLLLSFPGFSIRVQVCFSLKKMMNSDNDQEQLIWSKPGAVELANDDEETAPEEGEAQSVAGLLCLFLVLPRCAAEFLSSSCLVSCFQECFMSNQIRKKAMNGPSLVLYLEFLWFVLCSLFLVLPFPLSRSLLPLPCSFHLPPLPLLLDRFGFHSAVHSHSYLLFCFFSADMRYFLCSFCFPDVPQSPVLPPRLYIENMWGVLIFLR